MTDRTRLVRRAAVVGLVALAVVASAAPWSGALAIDGATPFLVAAAVLPVALPAVLATLRRGATVSFAASAAAWVALASTALVAGGAPLTDLPAGLVETPARLLSETLPFTGPRHVLVLPLLLVWLTGATAGELAARSRSAVAPAVPALVGFAAAHALTAGADAVPLAWAGLLALAALGTLALRQAAVDEEQSAATTTASAGPASHRLLAALGGAAAFAVVGTAAAAVAPTTRAEPAAPTRAAPLEVDELDDPIGVLALLRDTGDDPMYEVRVAGPAPGYLPIATLDRYDGDTWSFDRTFLPTGGRIPIEPGSVPPSPRRAAVTVRVLEHEPALPAIPYVERTLEVAGLDVTYDPATAMVRPASTPAPGDRYDLVVAPPGGTVDDLDPEARLVGSAVPADTAVPPELEEDLERVVARLEAQAGEPASPTVRFLAALAEGVRDGNRRVEPLGGERRPSDQAAATGGTSFAAVTAAVLTRHQAQPEQFATLVALVARHLGVPARVTTGFRLAPLEPGAASAPEGERSVGRAQVWTWVEVPVEGEGWVVVDATPLETGEAEEETFATTSTTSTTVPADTDAVVSASGGNAIADAVDVEPPASRSRTSTALLVAAGGIGLVAAALAVRRLARDLRRWRRRHAGPPRARVHAAWRELLLLLRGVGVPGLEAQAATEVAERVRARFGPEAGAAALPLAQAVNAALYASAEPDADAARTAWAEHDVIRRAVRRQTTRRRRLAEAWQRRRADRARRAHAPTPAT